MIHICDYDSIVSTPPITPFSVLIDPGNQMKDRRHSSVEQGQIKLWKS